MILELNSSKIKLVTRNPLIIQSDKKSLLLGLQRKANVHSKYIFFLNTDRLRWLRQKQNKYKRVIHCKRPSCSISRQCNANCWENFIALNSLTFFVLQIPCLQFSSNTIGHMRKWYQQNNLQFTLMKQDDIIKVLFLLYMICLLLSQKKTEILKNISLQAKLSPVAKD